MATFGKKIGILVLLALVAGPVSMGFGMDVPNTVTLDSLSRIYDGVVFDHAMHLDVTEDCATCHHHTTGTPSPDAKCNKCHAGVAVSQVIACRDCHAVEPFSAEYLKAKKADIHRHHTDQLGLKGAYHQSCLGCHQEMGGPTGCLECHQRNQSGDELFRAGSFSPKDDSASK